MTTTPNTSGGRFAIAIHGGAGAIDPAMADDVRQRYLDGLAHALTVGRDVLAAGGSALDAVERAVRALENDEQFNAGRGAVFTADGRHELDASIMDGRTLAAGGVAGVTTVRNPVSLARLAMEQSGHVLLVGDGAERFADHVSVERVANDHFDTPKRLAELQHKLEVLRRDPTAVYPNRGTVGAVALDTHGHLAAATSTGGMTAKRFGRVGDSPLVGAGTYADDRTVAVSGTGIGEQYIRHAAAHEVSARIMHAGQTVAAAAAAVVRTVLRPNDGGLIAVGPDGTIATPFSTAGMFRGAADSAGRFAVHIHDDGTGDGTGDGA